MFGDAVPFVSKLKASSRFFLLLEKGTIITEMKMIHLQSEIMGF